MYGREWYYITQLTLEHVFVSLQRVSLVQAMCVENVTMKDQQSNEYDM